MNDAVEGSPEDPRLEDPRLSEPGRRWVTRPDAFGVALMLILMTIFVHVAVGDDPWGQLIAVILGGGTLLFVLETSRARRVTVWIAGVVVALGIAGGVITLAVGGTNGSRETEGLIGLLLAFVAPVVILRRIVLSPTITFQLVLGALCIYLLVGLFFSYLFPLLAVVQGVPYFVQTAHPSAADYVYFSYVTLATVGYGDFTAATSLGRMFAASEALVGVLYLVSTVALLVGNVGRSMERGGRWRRGPGDREP